MPTPMNPTKRKILAKRKMEAARRARERASTRAEAKTKVTARKAKNDAEYDKLINAPPKKTRGRKITPKPAIMSTMEDKIAQEEELGIERDLNVVLKEAAKAARAASKKKKK